MVRGPLVAAPRPRVVASAPSRVRDVVTQAIVVDSGTSYHLLTSLASVADRRWCEVLDDGPALAREVAATAGRDLLADVKPSLKPQELLGLQEQVKAVKTMPALVDYLLALVQHTRKHPGLRQGLSPRAGLSLRRAAQAYALIEGRPGVIPEDVQAVFPAVVNHRLIAISEREAGAPTAEEILSRVAIP